MTAPAIELCALDAIAEPGSRAFEVDGLEGFIVRHNGQVRAYRDSCPHTGAPLAWSPDGYLDADDAFIQCALHGALFLTDSGECVHGPCLGRRLSPLPIVVEDGIVLLMAGGYASDEMVRS